MGSESNGDLGLVENFTNLKGRIMWKIGIVLLMGLLALAFVNSSHHYLSTDECLAAENGRANATASDAARPRKMSFRLALLTAAKKAYDSGEISKREYRRIRLASWRPKLLKKIETNVIESAVVAGVLPQKSIGDRSGIDWDQLIDFIRQLIEMIMELFNIASYGWGAPPPVIT